MRSEKMIVSVETIAQCVILKQLSGTFSDITCNKIPIVHCIPEECKLCAF